MKHIIVAIGLILCIALGLGGVAAQDPSPTPRIGSVVSEETVSQFLPKEAIERVVLISVDGLRPDAITEETAPNLFQLAHDGAATFLAQTILPPRTIPAHTSMLTGLLPEEHRIGEVEELGFPTIIVQLFGAGYRTGMIVGKDTLEVLYQDGNTLLSVVEDPEPVHRPPFGETEIIGITLQALTDGFDFLFVHIPRADFIGHVAGWMSESYLNTVGNIDMEIGRLLSTLEEEGLLDTTLIIVTADHGGETGELDHFDEIPENMTIPWIIYGPGVVSGRDLSELGVVITQTAPTILWAMEAPIPDYMPAPIVEAFGSEVEN